MTTTTNLGLTELTTGQTNKEVSVNDALAQLDAKLTAIAIIDCSTSGQAPTLAQLQSNGVILLENVTGAYTVAIPATFTGSALIHASAANTHAVIVTVGSATHTLAAGDLILASFDGTTNGMYVVAGGGVTPGGTTGQVLTKISGADGDVDWASPATGAVPTGGTAGQVLTKIDGTDYNADWETPSGGGGGGSVGTKHHWRFANILSFDYANPPSASELEIHATVGGSAQIPTSTTSSPYYGSDDASQLHDGNTSTIWAANGYLTGNNWVQYTYTTAVACAEIVVKSRTDNTFAQAWHDFIVLCSDDGVIFKEVCHICDDSTTPSAAFVGTYAIPTSF